MKLDHCQAHTGAGDLGLACYQVRHDDGRKAKPHEVWREIERLRELMEECAPHVFSAAEAAHLLDGFRPQRRPLDDLADRVRAALGSNVKLTGAARHERKTKP